MNQLVGQEVLLWRQALALQTDRQVENLKQGGEAAGRWVPALSELHGAVAAVPTPLGSDGTHSFWDHSWTVQQQKQCPSRASSAPAIPVCVCTPVLQWCDCWSHCSALSVHLCAPCHTGLSHAAAADQMLPLLAQILAIPAYFMQALFLPATPAQDWRWS